MSQSKKSALDALRLARQGGGRRSEQFSAKVDDVLVDVSEEQYRAEVDKRRRRGNFVVDDATGEYEDDGEEDKWDSAFYEEDLAASAPARKRRADGKAAAAASAAPAAGPGRLTEMFAKPRSAPKTATAAVVSAAAGDEQTATAAVADDLDLQELVASAAAEGFVRRSAVAASASSSSSAVSPLKRALPKVATAAPALAAAKTMGTPAAVAATVRKEEAAAKEDAPAAPSMPSPPQQPQQQPVVIDECSRYSDGGVLDEALCAVDLAQFTEANPVPVVDVVPTRAVPLQLDTHGNLPFYWIGDAAEHVSARDPGAVHLFGKVALGSGKGYASCCLIVHNVPRVVYLAPRSPVLDESGKPTPFLADVLEEIDEVREKARIPELRSKPVMRNYAFELEDVPRGCSSFLKVRIPPGCPPLPRDLSGRTFSHIIGTTAGPLEHVLIKCGLRGPGWLYIARPQIASTPMACWCSYEVSVADYKNVLHTAPDFAMPASVPLTLMGMSIKTAMGGANGREPELVAVSLCIEPNVDVDSVGGSSKPFTHTGIRRLGGPLPLGFRRDPSVAHVRECNSEKELLEFAFETIKNIDPDVLIGHNITGFDIDVLLHRARALNETTWSRLGRLRLRDMPRLQDAKAAFNTAATIVCRGRLVCDTYTMAQELIFKQRSYRLVELAETQLNEPGRTTIDTEEVPSYFRSADRLAALVRHNEDEARLVMRLAERVKMLSLTKQLTSLVGNLWSRTLAGHRAERVEYLLLHEFHRLKFVIPDHQKIAKGGGGGGKRKKKAAYQGGMVLEPRVGFYDKLVVLLDFKSLYPSLIQEYNVCFTTVQRKPLPAPPEPGQPAWLAEEPSRDSAEGVLPRVVRSLVEQRRRVKAQMDAEANDATKTALNIRQSALKLVANSLYGCLGFEFSRFYARPLAELITRKGRETLQRSMELVSSLGLSVIGGDTDSMMVLTGLDELGQAKDLARKVIFEINKKYRALEIDIDNVFTRMLLVKKKNYACIEAGTGKRQVKGLHVVRRDWCDLSKDVGQFILDTILKGNRDEVAAAIYSFLRETAAKMHQKGAIPFSKFGITKSLSKDPDAYDDAKSQPHVLAAKLLRAHGKKLVSGDYVTYVIVKEQPSAPVATVAGQQPVPVQQQAKSAIQRAFPLELLGKDQALEIDVEWYLTAQIFPPAVRLCRPIEEIDISQLAECLGLDPRKHAIVTASASNAPGNSQSEGLSDQQFSQIVEALSSAAADPFHALHENYFEQKEAFIVQCPFHGCTGKSEFLGLAIPMQNPGMAFPDSALRCSKCKRPYSAASVGNQLLKFVRDRVSRHYSGKHLCKEEGRLSRTLVLRYERVEGGERLRQRLTCGVPGCRSEVDVQYPEANLYYELIYLRSLFDVRALESSKAHKPRLSEAQRRFFDAVYRRIDSYVQKNAYHWVPLSLFDLKITAPAPAMHP